ncbi:MAG: uracil-DNA glycosylase [Candidatus Poribacteria bacterium]|nr:uracil-DNA glycosylase [Candidatus Poribacteria bacterium]
MSAKNPLKLSATCQRCPELVRNRHRIVHGYGEPDADFLFIGEAPGAKGADLTGVPFTRDRSGKRLQRLLIQLGLSSETDEACESPRLINCYVTNLIRCNPPGNRNPTKAEIENCQPYLEEEIQRVRPKVVISIGNFATRWVFWRYRGVRPAPITRVHAQIFGGLPFTIVPMKHPARISHRMLAEIETVLRNLRERSQHQNSLKIRSFSSDK